LSVRPFAQIALYRVPRSRPVFRLVSTTSARKKPNGRSDTGGENPSAPLANI